MAIPLDGPGTELKILIEKLTLTATTCASCLLFAEQMNLWGVAGCREHRAEIVEHLREALKHVSYAERAKAAIRAVQIGLVFKLNPMDPFPGLVDEAITAANHRGS